MGIRSSGASILSSDSLVSGTLVIVNKPAGFTVTGGALKSDTALKKSIVTPGSTESILDIGGAGTGPTITSLTVTDESGNPLGISVIDADRGGYLEIVGTNFESTTVGYILGVPLTTTFVDSTKIRVVVPAAPIALYNVMVFNDDNVGILYPDLQFSIAPTFITPAGSLGQVFEFTASNLFVSANSDSAITYSIDSGSLPSGITLSAGNGNIQGTYPTVSSNTTFSFVAKAQDLELQSNTRSYSITVRPDVVTWLTPANNITIIALANQAMDNVFISSTSLVNSTIVYSNVNLPAGIELVQSNIIGTPTSLGLSNVTLIATSSLTSKFANLSLRYKVVDPYVIANYTRDISGVTFFGNTAATTTPVNISFSPDGGNLYLLQTTAPQSVYQYTLSIPWDITNKTQIANFSITASGETSPFGLFIGDAGRKMYISGSAIDRVHEYSLTTPYNVDSAVLVGNVNIIAFDASSGGIYFSDDGTQLFVAGRAGDDIGVFTLSTAWQANTATLAGTFIPSSAHGVDSLFFNSDATKLYILDVSAGDIIYQYNLDAPWDVLLSSNVSNKSLNLRELVSSIDAFTIAGFFLSADEKEMIILTGTDDSAIKLKLSNAGEIDSASQAVSGYFLTRAIDATATGLDFSTDGTRAYFVGTGTDSVQELALSTPWDIGTGRRIANINVNPSSIEATPQGVKFKPDGTKMYIIGDTADRVHEWFLSTAWQVNTAVRIGFYSIGANTNPIEGTWTDLAFKDDGTRMYAVGEGRDKVFEFALTTPWQANSAVNVGNVDVGAQEATSRSLDFSHDGTKFALAGDTTDTVYRYNMSTAWQVNTATYVDSLSLGDGITAIEAIKFVRNGLYMYVMGSTGNVTYPTAAEGIFRYIAG